MQHSDRSKVAPFHALDVLRRANALEAAGRSIVHLEIGQPAARAPEAVIERAQASVAKGRIGYTDALGIPALRNAIAADYRHRNGVEVSPDRVVVTSGSSGGFILTFLAAFDSGARVALATPAYPAYKNILSSKGIEPVLLQGNAQEGFLPTPALLEAEGGRLDGLIVGSPANPTGAVLSAEQLNDLAEYCRERKIRLISDEIYHGVTFGAPAATAAALDANAIVVNSFSKYYCMPGWRLGWLVLPEALVRPVEQLLQSLFISAHTISQEAAVGAFEPESQRYLDGIVAGYRENRDTLLAGLADLGITRVHPAEGAFYLYPDVSDLCDDSAALAETLLEEEGVALTPGIDFDQERGHRYLRVSFAGSKADMEEALRRLKAWRNRS